MEASKTLLCSSKFSWTRETVSSKFIDARSKRFASPGLQRDDERVNAVFITPTFAYTCYYVISATSVRI